MEIKTERLLLRPWRAQDAAALYEQAKNPNVGPIAGWPVHTSVENSREIIETVLSAPETYAVCLLSDGIPIGSIGLLRGKASNLALADEEAEIGYWIGQDFWGQGLIPEAIRALTRRAFLELGVTCLWCGYFDGNERSKRAQEKCGFTYHHTNENIHWALTDRILTEHVTCLPRRIALYVHGRGGKASEFSYYTPFCPGYTVIGVEYPPDSHQAPEALREIFEQARRDYGSFTLMANSIGAYFSMRAGVPADKALLISPVVDMAALICDMMRWAGVSEEELRQAGEIHTAFGETLSWEELRYARAHPIVWDTPTHILYATGDTLISRPMVDAFVATHDASLTVMPGGEHWFHTKEEMAFLAPWMLSHMS